MSVSGMQSQIQGMQPKGHRVALRYARAAGHAAAPEVEWAVYETVRAWVAHVGLAAIAAGASWAELAAWSLAPAGEGRPQRVLPPLQMQLSIGGPTPPVVSATAYHGMPVAVAPRATAVPYYPPPEYEAPRCARPGCRNRVRWDSSSGTFYTYCSPNCQTAPPCLEEIEVECEMVEE